MKGTPPLVGGLGAASFEPGGYMSDDIVVLWRDHDPGRDVWYEIVQVAEGEFELRILCDGRVWLTEQGPDWAVLLDRAGEIRSDLHSQGA